jgi:hypothetical protein
MLGRAVPDHAWSKHMSKQEPNCTVSNLTNLANDLRRAHTWITGQNYPIGVFLADPEEGRLAIFLELHHFFEVSLRDLLQRAEKSACGVSAKAGVVRTLRLLGSTIREYYAAERQEGMAEACVRVRKVAAALPDLSSAIDRAAALHLLGQAAVAEILSGQESSGAGAIPTVRALVPVEAAIVKAMLRQPSVAMTALDLEEIIPFTEKTIRKHLPRLRAQGLIVSWGAKRGWSLTPTGLEMAKSLPEEMPLLSRRTK